MHIEPFVEATPLDELARRLGDRPGLCWLDGSAAHPEGRYSMLMSDPVEWVVAPAGDPEPLARLAQLQSRAPDAAAPDPGSDRHGPLPLPSEVPRWVGYLAYDLCFTVGARRSRPPEPTSDAPLLCFARYAAVLIERHQDGRRFVIGDDAKSCQDVFARLQVPAAAGGASAESCQDVFARPACRAPGPLHIPDPAAHLAAIAQAKDAIAAGDVYQVNLARRFEARFAGDALALWSALRDASPVPLGMYFHARGPRVLSRSMERFLRWHRPSRALRTRPIKGTVARAPGGDAQGRADLLADPKERAEHVMIVDLMRNDLSRVAELGSVRVEEALRVEPFAGLQHLVSSVACRTRPDLGLRDILEATFPPGSVTGTPKLRAIEIIDQLEAAPRGLYTGALGFVDRAGGLSLSVAIRTAVLHGERLHYYSGGGIVEASDPQRELAETELKARVFFDALQRLSPGRELR
ncbi:MAG: anthranilate synthase component I family protein [Myxococcales bacterium]|nr:anthranilate synthase component I family protein [Myxococcales bacterium]